MTEERLIFRAYQRSLLRSLFVLEDALEGSDTETARCILSGLIEDTRSGLAEPLRPDG